MPSPAEQAWCNAGTALTKPYIDETLSIYHPEHVYVSEAYLEPPRLSAVLHLHHYPYARAESIDYVTASSLVLYIAQAGYLLTRGLIDAGWPFPLGLTTERFFQIRDKGDALITRLSPVSFRAKIPVKSRRLRLDLRLQRVMSSNGSVFAHISIKTPGGEVEGKATVALLGVDDEP